MKTKNYYWGIFFISTAILSFEIALVRYFSVASWSSFGTMIISIALFGFGASGTILTIFKEFFERHLQKFLFWLAAIFIPVSALSYYFTTIVPFNPLAIQNDLLWKREFLNIALYYLTLFFPYFFGGFYISLCFLAHKKEIGKIYFYDLIGAGVGSIFILLVMFFIHPLYLITVIISLAFIATLFSMNPNSCRIKQTIVASVLFLGSLALILFYNQATYIQQKPIYQARLMKGNKNLAQRFSPVGLIEILDNPSEKNDIPLSNAFQLKVPDGIVPQFYGIYVDGFQSDYLFVKGTDNRYIDYSLLKIPYLLKKDANALIIGVGGGFNLFKSLYLGANKVTGIESNPTLIDLMKDRFEKETGGILKDKKVNLAVIDNRAFLEKTAERYDLIEFSQYALKAKTQENFLITVEAIKRAYSLLKEGGIFTLSVSIQEQFLHAIKLLNTVIKALKDVSQDNFAQQIIFVKSQWTGVMIIKKGVFSKEEIKTITEFCSELSFDTVYFPGVTGNEELYNVGSPFYITGKEKFDTTMIEEKDKLKQDPHFQIVSQLIGNPNQKDFLEQAMFNFAPSTDDHPYFTSILKVSRIQDIMKTYKLSGLPSEEINYIALWATLIQAILFALLIVFLPLVKGIRFRRSQSQLIPKMRGKFKTGIYFFCLGIGFFFIEIVLIQKLALFLSDPIYSFSIVLSAVLLFSGVGSYISERYANRPFAGIKISIGILVLCLLLVVFGLDPILERLIVLPMLLKMLIIFLILAPVGISLGFFFPLGLSTLRAEKEFFIPWAWSINGAFSVISSILAKIISISYGFKVVILLALILYILAFFTFPNKKVLGAAPHEVK